MVYGVLLGLYFFSGLKGVCRVRLFWLVSFLCKVLAVWASVLKYYALVFIQNVSFSFKAVIEFWHHEKDLH